MDDYPRTPASWPLAVYVHLPFCAYRCRYCNFVFETSRNEGILVRTLDKILADTAGVLSSLRSSGWNTEVNTVFFGGGTPSLVPSRQLAEFLKDFFALWRGQNRHFSPTEITFEINPENLTPDLLKVLADAGVNRLSVGIQTFDDTALAALGRRCDAKTNHRALEQLARWPGRWTADLMTGLAGQTPEKLDVDLATLMSYQPHHVSLYALTIEPGTALADLVERREIALPEPELAESLWITARDFFVNAGLNWYEISNLARPGHESLHNQAYWQLSPYLGLGPGAASTLPLNQNWERWTQPKLFPWLTATPPEREVLSERAFLQEHFLTALRTSQGLNWSLIEERLSPRSTRWARDTATSWHAKGLLKSTSDDQFLSLTDSARLILDTLLSRLKWI